MIEHTNIRIEYEYKRLGELIRVTQSTPYYVTEGKPTKTKLKEIARSFRSGCDPKVRVIAIHWPRTAFDRYEL